MEEINFNIFKKKVIKKPKKVGPPVKIPDPFQVTINIHKSQREWLREHDLNVCAILRNAIEKLMNAEKQAEQKKKRKEKEKMRAKFQEFLALQNNQEEFIIEPDKD